MRIVYIFFFTSCALSYAQVDTRLIPYNDYGRVEFSEVLPCENRQQTELYLAASEWIAMQFHSAGDVIQMNDKEAGILVVKGMREYEDDGWKTRSIDFSQKFTLKIYAKDNKIKIVLTQILLHVNAGGNSADHPIEKLVSDEALYKPNGKPNPVTNTHKDQLFMLWEELRSNIQSFINKQELAW